jgi:hypothetical protein
MREIINLTEGVDVEKLVGDVRDQAVAEYGISGLQGQCEGIALELHDALTVEGINADFVFGRYAQPYLHDGETFEQTPHCWVETGDLILDPSHEQFGNNMLIIDKKSPAAKNTTRKRSISQKIMITNNGSRGTALMILFASSSTRAAATNLLLP